MEGLLAPRRSISRIKRVIRQRKGDFFSRECQHVLSTRDFEKNSKGQKHAIKEISAPIENLSEKFHIILAKEDPLTLEYK